VLVVEVLVEPLVLLLLLLVVVMVQLVWTACCCCFFFVLAPAELEAEVTLRNGRRSSRCCGVGR
jgi:hypothetical protein